VNVQFSASYDRSAKILSALVCLGLLAVVFLVHNLVIGGLSLLVLAICVAYSPRGYVIEGQSIVVRRMAGAASIALEGVREVRRVTAEDLRGCIRLRGSSGFFGYYGLFSTSKLGKCNWYVTDRSKSVVVITSTRTVLLSPDDTDGFLSAIRAIAPASTTGVVGTPEFTGPRRLSPLGTTIVVCAVLAAISLGVAASSYAPGPPGYTLTSDALTIHDRFYPVTLRATEVNLSGMRIVDLDQNTPWRPVRRTNGFANSHYQCGWFLAANGVKVRLYRAGGSRAVLLPPSGAGSPVLYQAADPDLLVEQLRSEWGRPASRLANAGRWIYYAQ
jgi:PH (Pleckstrin Homology) domain-containing protein